MVIMNVSDEQYIIIQVSAIARVMFRFRYLGKIGRERMKKGDFTNTPPKQKKNHVSRENKSYV